MSASKSAARLLNHNGHAIEAGTNLLKALANEKRLQILCLLAGKELSVTQINQQLALSQSALSQHLAILRRDQLVNTRRESQTIYYSLSSDSAKAIIMTLADHFAA
ncbi:MULTISPECIES: ArsR/SmtB family transcription factor [Halomonadaceae]|jgi:DNA-binding transcriptional ArsR family regulator|uniref:Metalloregulator ArsR/SmtB family transcription factor n=1 Tax=Vreelandella janggokensis TaxID=370767 RepID=A0ABT4ITL0_9GAMM|nr:MULTISPECIES: metalloregulator ArsR/SmtB family transcription factor [Halomonas]MCW4153477.1 metalloregulator ArsR/SmtB family transcription factor [Halomonas sp. 18H]MCZ0926332.1 metalloregulator ArsR/SmtB family transcription factor [Halomonas janggokensis]MCZ0928870.1 metalloregulator ArsR/SmtB family transcription factor [Halomonas janggokensis]MDR5885597.1 metalloregulator ArsR/SmtB family transcription factor [Halomonas janggokensis]QPL47844.1 winged helix-turn-helix transcriptional r